MKRSLAKRPLHFPFKAVQLARPFVDAAPPPWPWQHLFDAWTSEFSKQGFPIFKLPDRHIGDDGLETIAIEIRWGYFTNKEISEEMRKFACAHRPGNEACKEPKRKGQRPKAVIQSHLKALSVMRIWKLHNRNQWKRLKLVAKNCDYEGCARESEEYERRRRRAHGNQPMSDDAKVEMSKARAHALSFFHRLFPWEMPSNY